MGCHFLLQGIFLTQGSGTGSPAWQADCLPTELPGKPQRNCTGLKMTPCMLQLGQIMDNMIQKDQKPNCHSCGAIPGYWEQQQGSVRAPAHNTAKGWADHLSHPPGHTCALSTGKEPAQRTLPSDPSPTRSEQGSPGLTLSLALTPPAAAGSPVTPCLNFLSGLLSISVPVPVA